MGDGHSATKPGHTSAQEPSTAGGPTADGALTRRHFVLQDDRPNHLGEIDLAHMDPSLRCLLFTDGTVTRTLEVQALTRVSVDVVAQSQAPVAEHVASHLEV